MGSSSRSSPLYTQKAGVPAVWLRSLIIEMSVRDRSQMDGSGGMIGWNITFEDWYAIELKALKKYFEDRNFDKGGTGALFLPNTMKDNLIFNPAVKPGCYNRP